MAKFYVANADYQLVIDAQTPREAAIKAISQVDESFNLAVVTVVSYNGFPGEQLADDDILISTRSLLKEVSDTNTPWGLRAKELFDSEGPYADFAAWSEWFDGLMENQSVAWDVEMDTRERVMLYDAFCQAIAWRMFSSCE